MLNHRLFLLFAAILALPLMGHAEAAKPIKIIEPNKKAEPAKPAMIDTEKFQAGLYVGMLSVEGFNNNPVSGLSLSYQLNKNTLLLANYATSTVTRTTYEKREDLDFLSPSQREFRYVTLSGGYKLFTARSFFDEKHKYDSDVYLIAGIGNMTFAGNSGLGWSLGASYRVVFTDWLVVTADFRNHIFDTESVFNPTSSKLTQNLEWSIGFNALF